MFKLSIWNAWLLSLPFFAFGVFFMGLKKDVAKRMADMTGYSVREKVFTVTASIAPYLFMIATVWTPFVDRPLMVGIGISFYIIGMVLFAASLRVIVQTPQDKPFSSGPYRFSRNPLYVAATMVFMGICLSTSNGILFLYLAITIFPQHFMILAEERICREKYGPTFENYLKRVPRYLFL
jgi:protein-S-isoprenylcysteine O-methyltransferase Ste14